MEVHVNNQKGKRQPNILASALVLISDVAAEELQALEKVLLIKEFRGIM